MLLEKWQARINLVGPLASGDIWKRHIIDSAQLISHLPPQDAVLDIGSGAGFPGLILAVLGHKHMTLVESDKRKAAFLKEAARVTHTQVEVRNQRAEQTRLDDVFVVTARAFASLSHLLGLLEHGLKQKHKLLLLKGKAWRKELDEAAHIWSFDYSFTPSVTDEQGVILSLFDVKKKGAPV